MVTAASDRFLYLWKHPDEAVDGEFEVSADAAGGWSRAMTLEQTVVAGGKFLARIPPVDKNWPPPAEGRWAWIRDRRAAVSTSQFMIIHDDS